MSAFGFDITDETTHIFSVCIYSFFHSGFFDCHVQAVCAYSRNRGTGTTAVIRTIVVMAKFYDNPVSGTYPFDDIRPKTVIKSTAAGSSQCVILYCDFVRIEVVARIKSPSPLSVVSVSQCTCTHGGVTDQE